VDFVDLNRNGSVFINGSEEQFLNVVKKSKTIKRNFRSAEEEVKRLKQNEQQWLKERDALRNQLKQAQQLFNQENAEKRQIVKETESLQRQWSALQDLVNKDSGTRKINNETLQQIRINNSPAPQNTKLQRAASAKKKKFYQPYDEKIEELNDTLALSMCNASDLSIFSDDNSRDDIILDESNRSKHDAGFCIEIKSKSRQIAARRSYSMTSTTKSIVFTNKNQIESDHVKIEALSDKKELKKLVMKRRESRQQLNQSLHTTPTYIPGASSTYLPGATPTYKPGATPTYIPGATPTYIPGATPTNIPGATPLASTPIKVHRFQEKR